MTYIEKLIKDLEENEGITLGDDILPYVETSVKQAEQEIMKKVGDQLDSLPTFVYTGDMHSNSVHMVVKMEDVKAILNLQDTNPN